MEKYGFVYLRYDRKHKRYYIGCRWGKEDDGYVCSSNWMKQGYKHRPEDFRRRILSRVYTNRNDLLKEEYRWLSKIKNEELGKRYYNLHNHHHGHWSTNANGKLTIGQKISLHHANPEFRMIAREAKLGDKNPMKRPEVAQKVREKAIGRSPWNKGKTGVQKNTRKGKKYGPMKEEHKQHLRNMYEKSKMQRNINIKMECPVCHKTMAKPHFIRYNHGINCHAED